MTYDAQSGVMLDPAHEAEVAAELHKLGAIRDQARSRRAASQWRQPEVQAIYDRWMADHFGVLDLELLVTAAYNAGARNAVTAMMAFQDLGPSIGRFENRILSTLHNVQSTLEQITSEDR